MAGEVFEIADGHDNIAGLLPLDELSPPLFDVYDEPVFTEWLESEGQRSDSTGYPKHIGRPVVTVVFNAIPQPDILYLKANFGRYVTIFTLNKTTAEWRYFNAELIFPRLTVDNYSPGWYLDVRLTFTQLEDITP